MGWFLFESLQVENRIIEAPKGDRERGKQDLAIFP
jgi:hypothetical protein